MKILQSNYQISLGITSEKLFFHKINSDTFIALSMILAIEPPSEFTNHQFKQIHVQKALHTCWNIDGLWRSLPHPLIVKPLVGGCKSRLWGCGIVHRWVWGSIAACSGRGGGAAVAVRWCCKYGSNKMNRGKVDFLVVARAEKNKVEGRERKGKEGSWWELWILAGGDEYFSVIFNF